MSIQGTLTSELVNIVGQDEISKPRLLCTAEEQLLKLDRANWRSINCQYPALAELA